MVAIPDWRKWIITVHPRYGYIHRSVRPVIMDDNIILRPVIPIEVNVQVISYGGHGVTNAMSFIGYLHLLGWHCEESWAGHVEDLFTELIVNLYLRRKICAC